MNSNSEANSEKEFGVIEQQLRREGDGRLVEDAAAEVNGVDMDSKLDEIESG